MGNHMISHASGGGRIILSDGTLQEYEKAATVAEVMLDHPQQVVVEFNPKAGKPTPLPADTKLEATKVYMVLPKTTAMKRSMSCEEARQLLVRANAVLNSSRSFAAAYTGVLPLFARMCPAASTKSKEKENSESQMVLKAKAVGLFREMEMEMGMEGRVADCLSRQLSGKALWKPSLDTIKEKSMKAKTRHWLL